MVMSAEFFITEYRYESVIKHSMLCNLLLYLFVVVAVVCLGVFVVVGGWWCQMNPVAAKASPGYTPRIQWLATVW